MTAGLKYANRRRGRPAAQVALGLLVSAVGVALAVRGVEWQRVAAAITGAQPIWLVAAAAANAAAILVAGLRWRFAARPHADLSVPDAIDIVMICNLANVLLSRVGDLARAVLTGRRSRVAAGRVLGGVIVERFVDVLVLLILALALSPIVGFPKAVRAGVLLFAAMAAAALLTIWFAAPWFASLVRHVVAVVTPSGAERLAGTIEAFAGGVRTSVRYGQLFHVVGLSAIVWALSGLSVILTIEAIGLPVPWFAGLFVLLAINLGGVIPASPGSVGVYHYLVVLALSVWIPEPSAPFGVALVSHVLGLLATAALGAIGLTRQGVSLWNLAPSALNAATATGR